MTERERQAFIRELSFEGEIEDRDGVLGFTVKRTSIWPQCSKVFMIRRLIPQFNGSISDIVSRIKWYGTRWNSILDAVMMGGIVCLECSSSATGNGST